MKNQEDLLYQDFREDCTISLYKEGRVHVDYGTHGNNYHVLDDVSAEIGTLSGRATDDYDVFHKVAHYISVLIEVSGKTEHKVHNEIAEAVKKLKELAYNERA